MDDERVDVNYVVYIRQEGSTQQQLEVLGHVLSQVFSLVSMLRPVLHGLKSQNFSIRGATRK